MDSVNRCPGTPLPIGQVSANARLAGFKGDALKTMVAIAIAESGGNPWCHNPNPPDDSYGLWQINMIGGLGPDRRKRFGITNNNELYDPLVNAKAAYELSGGGQNFKPWTTYTSGAYRKYLDQAAAVAPKRAGITDAPFIAGGRAVDGGKKAVEVVVKAITDKTKQLVIEAVVVAGGVALIVIGAYRMVSGSAAVRGARNAAGVALAPETGGASLAAGGGK